MSCEAGSVRSIERNCAAVDAASSPRLPIKAFKSRCWSAVVMLLLFVFLLPCRAASFSCNGQISNIERTICSNKDLSLLDERLASAFSIVREKFGSTAMHEQRTWLMWRDLCKVDVRCLKNSYDSRIYLLNLPNYEPQARRGLGFNSPPPDTISNLSSNQTIGVVLQTCFAEPACRQYSSALIPRFSKSTLIPESGVIDQLQRCTDGPSNSAICWSFRATFLENELADLVKSALQGAEETCESRLDRKPFMWERTVDTACDREASIDPGSAEYAQALLYCRGNRIRDQIDVVKSIGSCRPCSKCLAAW